MQIDYYARRPDIMARLVLDPEDFDEIRAALVRGSELVRDDQGRWTIPWSSFMGTFTANDGERIVFVSGYAGKDTDWNWNTFQLVGGPDAEYVTT